MADDATPSPTPDYGSTPPSNGEHSFFWYFFVIGIELAMLAGLVIVTHFTVTKGSGLNDPEKVRRIWGRAPEIRLQPVLKPLWFALSVGYGAQTVIQSLISGVFALIGIGYRNHFINIVISLFSFAAASWLCMVIYRVAGGTMLATCIVAAVSFDWFMSGVIINIGLGLYKQISDSFLVGFLLIAGAMLILHIVFQVPFMLWGQHTPLPPTARPIYNSSIVPGWVKLDRTILVASGPLAFIYFVAYLCESKLTLGSYWGNITEAFAVFMLLAASALAAIISVNRALLSNEFQWQWRAFLTPAVPLGAMKLLFTFFSVIRGKTSFLKGVWVVIHFPMSCGSCGVLGAYVYMMLAERYAKAHYDEDELAQDDILNEFEEDEDNEELEV